MGFKSKYAGAEVEAMLDDTKPPYIINSFTLQDLTEARGNLEIHPRDMQGGEISQALSEGRRVLLRIGPEEDGYTGSIDTNASEEDLVYLDFYYANIVYAVEIGSSICVYVRYPMHDIAREVAEDVVMANMPTEVATAMQKVQLTSAPSLNSYTANRVYEWKVSVDTLTISTLYAPNTSYDNVWVIRFGCQEGVVLNITPSVYWKDGVAPSFGAWGICELIFKKDTSTGVYLGEWKIYK